MVPANVIEDLKFRNNIEDVIASYVTLSRSGSNLKGLCPFHSEKTPSFTVYSGDGHFYCFGCGAGGDVISFIMRMENLDYRAALDYLAQRCGITLPDDDSRERGGVSRQRVIEMNRAAAKFFHHMLMKSEEGQAGRDYFAKRKLSGATIKHFGLGYAPNSYDGLKKYLREKGFTDEEMVAGYLCQRSRKNEKNIYDCFRGRVMFPIIDVAGNVVAFGGRVLDDSQPKYLNSSDTPAFKKSRNLFALNYAKNKKEDYLILCEGYMDVIALHAAGFTGAVATLGTAITPEQARIMKKYTDKVVICYDSDEAGQKAADKAMRLLSEVDISVRVIRIPGAKDPDEFIKSNEPYGAVRFREVIENARTPFDYKIFQTLSKYDISDAEQKVRAAKELCYAIADIRSKVEQDIYIRKAAKALELDAEGIKADVRGIAKRRAAAQKKKDREELLRNTARLGDRVDPDFAKEKRSGALESTVLGLMLYRPEYIQLDADKSLLDPEMFFSELNRRLYLKIRECYDSGGFEFGMLSEGFSQEEISKASEMIAKRRALSNNGEAAFLESVEALAMEAEKIKNRGSDADIESVIERRRKENKN
ncbi:MAG: DNA primase [Ruminococcaceae bacterium]|nr:DNA primase [Oscillospiraceae bacterium]